MTAALCGGISLAVSLLRPSPIFMAFSGFTQLCLKALGLLLCKALPSWLDVSLLDLFTFLVLRLGVDSLDVLFLRRRFLDFFLPLLDEELVSLLQPCFFLHFPWLCELLAVCLLEDRCLRFGLHLFE